MTRASHISASALGLLLVLASACSKVEFLKQAADEATKRTAIGAVIKRLEIVMSSSMPQKRCGSPIVIRALDARELPVVAPASFRLAFEGMRAGDQLFAKEDCTGTAVDVTAISFPAGTSEIRLYPMWELSGDRAMRLTSDFATQTARGTVTREVAAIVMTAAPTKAVAGSCAGPYRFEVRDRRNDPYVQTAMRYAIEPYTTNPIVFSDAACTTALTDLRLNGAAGASFYVKTSPSVLSVKVRSLDVVAATPSLVETNFERAVLGLKLTTFGIPVLGVPQSVTIQSIDLDGEPVNIRAADVSAPSTNALKINATFPQGEGVTWEFCDTAVPAAQFEILIARSATVACVRFTKLGVGEIKMTPVSSRPIAAASGVYDIVERPVSLKLEGPSSVVAGVTAGPYRVTLLNGIGNAMNPPSPLIVTLGGPAMVNGTICARTDCDVAASTQVTISNAMGTEFFLLSTAPATITAPLTAAAFGNFGYAITGASRDLEITRAPFTLAASGFGVAGFSRVPPTPNASVDFLASGKGSSGRVFAVGHRTTGSAREMLVAGFRGATGPNAERTGTLDASFGTAGVVTRLVGQQSFATAVLPYGAATSEKIAVAFATYAATTGWDMGIAIFNAMGVYESGRVFALAGNQYPTALAIGDAGLYIGGETETAIGTDMIVALHVIGTGTWAFGTNGILTLELGTRSSVASLVTTSSGTGQRLLIAGNADGNIALVRVNREGLPDYQFGSQGRVYMNFSGEERLAAAVTVSVGELRYILAGSTKYNFDPEKVFLIGLTFSGAPVASFGTQGQTILDVVPNRDEKVFSLSVDDNSIFLGGQAVDATTNDAFVARFTLAGKADTALLPWYREQDLGTANDRFNSIQILQNRFVVPFGNGGIGAGFLR